MSETLGSRTARSAIFIVRESLRSLRQYSADPANIDRIIKESQILSTSLKKLDRYLDAPAVGQLSSDPATREGPLIDIQSVNRVLKAIHDGRICAECSGVIEGNLNHKHSIDVGTPEKAKAHRATEDE